MYALAREIEGTSEEKTLREAKDGVELMDTVMTENSEAEAKDVREH